MKLNIIFTIHVLSLLLYSSGLKAEQIEALERGLLTYDLNENLIGIRLVDTATLMKVKQHLQKETDQNKIKNLSNQARTAVIEGSGIRIGDKILTVAHNWCHTNGKYFKSMNLTLLERKPYKDSLNSSQSKDTKSLLQDPKSRLNAIIDFYLGLPEINYEAHLNPSYECSKKNALYDIGVLTPKNSNKIHIYGMLGKNPTVSISYEDRPKPNQVAWILGAGKHDIPSKNVKSTGTTSFGLFKFVQSAQNGLNKGSDIFESINANTYGPITKGDSGAGVILTDYYANDLDGIEELISKTLIPIGFTSIFDYLERLGYEFAITNLEGQIAIGLVSQYSEGASSQAYIVPFSKNIDFLQPLLR